MQISNLEIKILQFDCYKGKNFFTANLDNYTNKILVLGGRIISCLVLMKKQSHVHTSLSVINLISVSFLCKGRYLIQLLDTEATLSCQNYLSQEIHRKQPHTMVIYLCSSFCKLKNVEVNFFAKCICPHTLNIQEWVYNGASTPQEIYYCRAMNPILLLKYH